MVGAGAALGLAGCSGSPEAETKAPAEEAKPASEPAATTSAASNQPAFLTPPDPIPESEIIETVDCDIVICGAGICGLPAAMLAAVPVKYGQHRGVWLCGAAGVQGVPMDRLLPKIMEGCLRAYGASGFDFAVTTPDDARRAEDLKTLGFKSQLPLRVIQTPIRRDLFAQAAFDSLTVHKLLERRHIYQPGCISLPEEAMNETMTQLYRRGLTVVSTRRGYGLYFTKGDTLQFLELQADNDHCADQLLQAAREKTGAANARILLAENQTLYLGAGRRCGYGMIAFLGRPFSVTDAYFRMLL